MLHLGSHAARQFGNEDENEDELFRSYAVGVRSDKFRAESAELEDFLSFYSENSVLYPVNCVSPIVNKKG